MTILEPGPAAAGGQSGGGPSWAQAVAAVRKAMASRVLTAGKSSGRGKELPMRRAMLQETARGETSICTSTAVEVPGLQEPTLQDKRLWALLQCCPVQAACLMGQEKCYMRPLTKNKSGAQGGGPMVTILEWFPESGKCHAAARQRVCVCVRQTRSAKCEVCVSRGCPSVRAAGRLRSRPNSACALTALFAD